jgi:putative N6-adenine-specific DNA methylase
VTRVNVFVVTAPGLEELTAGEVRRLGPSSVRVIHGGIECSATWPQVWSLNLRLRTATRVFVRVARFHADGFRTLRRGLEAVDWPAWLPTDGAIEVHATSSQSRLFHTGAIAEHAFDALARPAPARGQPADQVHVRLVRDVATVSLDSSGPPLHRRGWRQATAKAPLRETLAASLLLASGWDGRAPLIDPFCGSGTIPIEASLLAMRAAPGRDRSFAFERWPTFDTGRWSRLLAGARADEVARPVDIAGMDRDAGAIEAATANAARAGVDVELSCQALSALSLPSRPGWLVTNPPYGVRVGEERGLRDLYDRLGAILAGPAAGWTVGLLAPPGGLVDRLRAVRPFEEVVRTTNGGLPVSVLVSSPQPAS